MRDPLLAIYGDWFFGASLLVYTLALLSEIVEYSSRRQPAKALVAVGSAAVSTRAEEQDPAAARTLSDRFGRMAVSLLVLGTVLHLSSIVLRGLSAGRWPMGNMYEYVSAVCLVAIVGWLVTVRRIPSMRPVGIFVVPVVLVLMFLGGTLLYTVSGPLVPALRSYWMIFHVSTAVISSGLFLLPGIASFLYLLRRSGRLRRLGDRLPSVETLDRVAYRVTIAAFPLYTFGVISGAIWAEASWGRFWGWDPKETVAFVAWVIYAAYLHARATAGWRAPRAAWINVAGFATIVFNLFFVNLVIAGLHSYAGV